MTLRLPTTFVAALAIALTACPGDDSPVETDGASSSSGGADSTTTGTPTTLDGTTTDAMTSGGTTGSTGMADSSSGGTTEGATDSGSTGGSSSSSDGGSESSGSSSGGMMGDPCDGMEVLLYEQAPGMFMDDPGSPAGDGVGGFARSADDFVVPAGDQCWCITRVVLPGSFQMSMLSGDLEVGFYEDAGGLPMGVPLTTDSGAPIDMAGTFDYTLGAPVILDAATYWLSAMPTIPNSIDGIWFWAPGATSNGSSWAFESNIGMLPPACIGGWVDLNACTGGMSPFVHDDTAFEIYGVVGGDACM